MAGSIGDYYRAGRSAGVISSVCQSTEAVSEWRSSEQVVNSSPSTSPLYWDTDDEQDQFGLKPSELYKSYTWKLEKFSEISKRELRSGVFEVGGYKWYILIYPKGCDVCNHLSLFLCVADHDKLLPGWSHFAQFTISVVNREPKKFKYSDTLHRFWKKEHDWGWKKFMEISKVLDGFIISDTLEIRAQVQVIREKADRPFRCLDYEYRRELVRVYLTNVEQICWRFVEEKREKLKKLIEDRATWESFCEFWENVDSKTKANMYREKSDAILKVIVKQFFVEKEVTSTLVMDSLYSGLKVLECQNKSKKGKALYTEETAAPIVRLENDMFVLVGDMLQLLKRSALEPLPPKDEKGPQTRTKDGNSGEDFNKVSIERDERRLTELGRRTVEIFVLAHIFSTKIEVKHQEAVALKMQEELIREEEEAWQADFEKKGKRAACEKDKRAKKKQSKHKKSSRKGKDKGKEEKLNVTVQDNQLVYAPIDNIVSVDVAAESVEFLPEMPVIEAQSDVSDIIDSISENLQVRKMSTNVMDDSSSTCSTDSVLSAVVINRDQTSPTREDNQVEKVIEVESCQYDTSQSYKPGGGDTDAVLSLKDQIKVLQQHLVEKEEEEVVALQKKLDVKDEEQILEGEATPFVSTPVKIIVADPFVPVDSVSTREIRNLETPTPQKIWKATTSVGTSKPHDALKSNRDNLQDPLVPSPRVVSAVETPPPSSSSLPQNYVPQSYRMGENMVVGRFNHPSPSPPPSTSQPTTSCMVSPPQNSTSSSRADFTFGSVSQDVLHGQPPWTGGYREEATRPSSTEDFPHLDIINDLLDEEYTIGSRDIRFNQLSSSSSSSGYHHEDGMHFAYGYGTPYDTRRSNNNMLVPQVGGLTSGGYGNGHVLSAGYQNQWPMSHQMSSMLNTSTESNAYRYELSEYLNLTTTVVNGGGYNMYCPSNGL
ncbi:hypothetical protein ACHQM5_027280 [Ranunculus cassubicifolius]